MQFCWVEGLRSGTPANGVHLHGWCGFYMDALHTQVYKVAMICKLHVNNDVRARSPSTTEGYNSARDSAASNQQGSQFGIWVSEL